MKKNLAVIFGGRSSEHEVSCVSVVTIAKAVDLEKYNMFLIGITKDGEWKLAEDIASIEDGSCNHFPGYKGRTYHFAGRYDEGAANRCNLPCLAWHVW